MTAQKIDKCTFCNKKAEYVIKRSLFLGLFLAVYQSCNEHRLEYTKTLKQSWRL